MPEIKKKVQEIDEQLKRFQSASVDYVLDQFYKNNRNKVLIADEVGLGKTIIAKGVIAKCVDKERKKPFHVVYICSNQVLAQQNISKLNPFEESERPLNRLIFLAFKPSVSNNAHLRLSSLTPGTSFKLTNSVGYKEERALILRLLYDYKDFQNLEVPLSQLMKGNKQVGAKSWEELVERYLDHGNDWIRPELGRMFKERLESLPFSCSRFPKSREYLGNREYSSLYSGLKALLRKLESVGDNPLDFSYEIIRVLRKELTQLCVSYLNADLFILDEFQRFKTLLDGEDESEAGEIAKAVLQNDNARVLLLSATPFKPYTTQLDQLNGEDHHTEFKKIVEFLGGSKGATLWKSFRQDQEAFFNILRHPKDAINNLKEAQIKKVNLEDSFKGFLSRNERLSVAKEYDNMIANNTNDSISIIKDDISNFIAIDRLVSKLNEVNSNNVKKFGSTIEFAKSAPYPLSFLHGYKLYENFKEELKTNKVIKDFVRINTDASLSLEKIKHYKPIGFNKDQPSYPNGKLRLLADECFKGNADKLLWVAPTKPYYKPFGAYKEADDFSKILVFSGWVMAPRAISTLLSYEVERRTVGSERISDTREKEERTYFDQPRKPLPLFTYSKGTAEQNSSYQMSNSTLTYPGMVLFENCVLRDLIDFNSSFAELRNTQAKRLKILVKEFNIEREYVVNKKEDSRWYWVMSALLDALKYPEEYLIDCLIDQHKGNKKSHYIRLKNTVNEIIDKDIRMGQFPEDLFRVLADISIGSPSNAVLFAYMSNFELNNLDCFVQSHLIADAFLSHFNKPESISVIRMSSKDNEFWRQVLEYGASGNITSMLDEYFYMLRNCNGLQSVDAIKDMMLDVLTVNTSSIGVDMNKSKASIQTKNMRCHFAVNFGDGKMDTHNKRSINIRTVFNSPFRPFVLASTSIGQEGLDFHFYCRKIFHWNLPHNAIDIEQREGRINRFKGLVIRKKIVEMFTDQEIGEYRDSTSIWNAIFKCAEDYYKDDVSQIKPFWYIDNKDHNGSQTMIERFVPIHEFSKDKAKYEQLKSTLALYRLTFGQPRQEELVEAFKNSGLTEEQISELRKSLLINLSPLNQ